MSLFSVLTISCPQCGHSNSITTSDLPLGTPLGCSHCGREVAHWQGSETGFVPSRHDASRLHSSEMEKRAGAL